MNTTEMEESTDSCEPESTSSVVIHVVETENEPLYESDESDCENVFDELMEIKSPNEVWRLIVFAPFLIIIILLSFFFFLPPKVYPTHFSATNERKSMKIHRYVRKNIHI